MTVCDELGLYYIILYYITLYRLIILDFIYTPLHFERVS